jgi:hypothetical protein
METETFLLPTEKLVGKTRRAQRGVFEKVRDSGIWWIRYIDGKRRAPKGMRKTSTQSEKMRRWQGKSCLRSSAAGLCHLARLLTMPLPI